MSAPLTRRTSKKKFGDAGNCTANRIITFLKEFYQKNTRWNPAACPFTGTVMAKSRPLI